MVGRRGLEPLIPCASWISPHPSLGDTTFGRLDQLRLLPEHDPLFAPLYGMRNDSEGVNICDKRSLLADRAATRGWRRQVLDLTSWAILGNSLAWSLYAEEAMLSPDLRSHKAATSG